MVIVHPRIKVSSTPCSQWGLPLHYIAIIHRELLPHTFHHCSFRGCFVSVVLSLSFRTVAVSDHCILCCPDFPLNTQRLPFGPASIISYYSSECIPLSLSIPKCLLIAIFTSKSAFVFNSLFTCTNAAASKFLSSSFTSL